MQVAVTRPISTRGPLSRMAGVFLYFFPCCAVVFLMSYLLMVYVDDIIDIIDIGVHRVFDLPPNHNGYSVRPWLSCGKYVTPRDAVLYSCGPAFVYWTVSFGYVLLDWYVDEHNELASWKHPHARYIPRIDYNLYKRAMRMMIVIKLTNVVALIFFILPAIRTFRMSTMCDVPELLPSPVSHFFGLLWRAPIIYLLTDVVFYWSHRLCHEVPWLYRHVHKSHHAFIETYGICASACHPIEQIFVNLNGIITPSIIVGLPFHWLTIWLCITAANSVGSHSGYHWGGAPAISSLPHDQHHKFQLCEYGVSVFCDRLFGTRYEDMLEARANRQSNNKTPEHISDEGGRVQAGSRWLSSLTGFFGGITLRLTHFSSHSSE